MKAETRRSRRKLSLESGALLMVGIGTLALIGLPSPEEERAAQGLIEGRVLDEAGHAITDAPVGLFDGSSNTLLEITHTGDDGRFGFQQDPGPHHVYVGAPAGSGLLGSFALDCEVGRRMHELTLRRGVEVVAHVFDADGEPLERAEVRAYARSGVGQGASIAASTYTDAYGVARFRAPGNAHFAALSPNLRHLPRWRFDHHASAGDAPLEFHFPEGVPIRGTVVDASDRPLENVLVSAWEDETATGGGWHWNGYQRTRAGGEYFFYGSAQRTVLRAFDCDQARLPAERRIEGPSQPVLVLRDGECTEIRCRDEGARPVDARVWMWSESAHAWSWGARTNARGLLEACVDPDHAFVAEPLHSGAAGVVEAFGQTWRGAAVDLIFSRPAGSSEGAEQQGQSPEERSTDAR